MDGKFLTKKERKMNKVTLLALGCFSLGIVSASGETTAQKAAAKEFAKYNQTGEYKKCISNRLIDKTVIGDDTKIIFEMKNNKFMLNTLKSECRNLNLDRKFNFSVNGGKVCGKDVISTRVAACMLSDFEILEEKS